MCLINLLTEENTRTQITNETITPRTDEKAPNNSYAKKAQMDATIIAINIGIDFFLWFAFYDLEVILLDIFRIWINRSVLSKNFKMNYPTASSK